MFMTTPDPDRPAEVRLGVDVADFVAAMRQFGEAAADPHRLDGMRDDA